MPQYGKKIRLADTDLNTELLVVADRFPAFHERLVGLYNQSVEFQGLCSDYHLCITGIGLWETRTEYGKQFLKEYTDVKLSLEQELCRFLEKSLTG